MTTATRKILAGGPARETSSLVYQLHREGLEAQGRHSDCVGDGSRGNADDGAMKKGAASAPAFDIEVRHEIVKDPGGARWQHDKIGRVAQAREEFMDAAHTRDAALFMVDTDVILGPGVLERMWAVDADVVYGVYLTYSDWGGSMHPWPQVWDITPYGWRQETADALNAPGVNEVEVLGGGACTLIRGRGFESRYWPLLQSLTPHNSMLAGEDRSYCLGLEARGIKQIAVTNLPIHHCYTLADQTRPALERIREKVGLSTVAP